MRIRCSGPVESLRTNPRQPHLALLRSRVHPGHQPQSATRHQPSNEGGSKVKTLILDSLAVVSFVAGMILLLALGSMR